MSSVFNYIGKILSDADGFPSSKRWISLVAFLMVIGSWVMDVFYGMTSTDYIFNALIFLIVGCLGITGAEKFAAKE